MSKGVIKRFSSEPTFKHASWAYGEAPVRALRVGALGGASSLFIPNPQPNMASEYTTVYETEVEVPIRIGKNTPEEARLKRLERWPKEAGLSQPLGEGGSFMNMVKEYSATYDLQPGERSWSIERSGDSLVIKMKWSLLRNGVEKGYASISGEIPLRPSEEGDNFVYVARLKYSIAISNDVLSEKATSDLGSLGEFNF